MELNDLLDNVRKFTNVTIIMLLTNFIAVEKNNDDARRNYHSSNRLDGAKEIVPADARLETLRDYAREKRPYNKTNSDYWERDIYEKRKRTE